jgi:hypothetical protein
MAGRNFDYPRPLRGRMAKNALRDMAQHADQLEKSLTDDDALPAWVDYYIATSSDRMHTVGNYMQGELRRFKPSTQAQQNTGYGAPASPPDAALLDAALDSAMRVRVTNVQVEPDAMKLRRALILAYILGMPVAAMIAYNKNDSPGATALGSLGSFPYALYRWFKK